MKRRLDQVLVERGLASSRTRAQDLIHAGQVEISEGGRVFVADKVSLPVGDDAGIRIREGEADRFVSRAGLKLEGAFEHIGLDVRDWRVLDVGQSTGGFTDCVLQRGAARVVGIEVGHGQLHARLRGDSRILTLENTHIRDAFKALSEHCLLEFDLAVVDVSFIPLELVLPSVTQLVKVGGALVALVKPQFELGPEAVSKSGIVRDALLYERLEDRIKTCLKDLGWSVQSYFESPVPGRDGNREFFVHGTLL